MIFLYKDGSFVSTLTKYNLISWYYLFIHTAALTALKKLVLAKFFGSIISSSLTIHFRPVVHTQLPNIHKNSNSIKIQ